MKRAAETLLQRFTTANFFAFRTPLLPFDELLAWSDGLQAPGNTQDPVALNEAVTADRNLLRQRLSAIVSRAEIQEAIFLASPDLSGSITNWRAQPNGNRARRIEAALVRYFTRMCSRATPFGLFAGYSVGSLGEQTQLTIAERNSYQRHTRPDMDYLFTLAERLNQIPAMRSAFLYRPNSSLYHSAGNIRYVESRLKERERTYHLVTVEETDEINTALVVAKNGAMVHTLVSSLLVKGIDEEEANEFIAELIDNQILVPDVALTVSGPEPLHALIAQLKKHPDGNQYAKILEEMRDTLASFDSKGTGCAEPHGYRNIADRLKSLPVNAELARLFQVDMIKPAPHATLGKEVLDEIIRGAELLHSIVEPPPVAGLDRFREAFVTRYERREVPLLEALDEEIGIGFEGSSDNSPLLRDLDFSSENNDMVKWNEREAFLLRKIDEAARTGAQEIALEPGDLKYLEIKKPLPLPDTFAAMAMIAADSDKSIADGNFRVMMENVHASGARLMGRFCHADDRLRRLVEEYVHAEETLNPESIFAEIVHLPEGRVGNILARPAFRSYEIPYLGYSAMPREKQIPASDLLVSVRNNRIVLRSITLGREIIPRMTNAHNYDWISLGFYRFLCSLQFQGTAIWLNWNWGVFKSAPFLPRLIYGKLVVSFARWLLDHEEILSLTKCRDSDLFNAVQRLRSERGLPRWIALRDYDKSLVLDLHNVLSIEMFVHLVRNRQEAILVEIFPAPDQLCARGPEGRFVHELVVPFVKIPDSDKSHRFIVSSDHPDTLLDDSQRIFGPASEWLYVKLYTGTLTADQILRQTIPSLVERFTASRSIDRWFFLRYGDPDWHLRLRFHGKSEQLQQEVLPVLQESFQQLLSLGTVRRVQIDTYEREVERYGGPEGMLLAEKIFHTDSEAVLKLLSALEFGDEGLEQRWRLTLLGIDLLLSDFGFDLKTKLEVIQRAKTFFSKELRVSKNISAGLAQNFRKYRKDLETLIDLHSEDDSMLRSVEILRHRSENLAPMVGALHRCEQGGKLAIRVKELALSYIHMYANRLLQSSSKRQELIIYDFLKCLYESRLARTSSSLR